MLLDSVAVSKLVRTIYLPENRQVSELRDDIRAEIRRERRDALRRAGEDQDDDGGGGGHFQIPFWAAAKEHVIGQGDLHDSVDALIELNWRRRRLYHMLRDGFLVWFNERRRWTNEPFRLAPGLRDRLVLDDDCELKIENFLAVSDAGGITHYVYPYFSETPPLAEQGARLILWALTTAFPRVRAEELRVLDVIRGNSFSVDRVPLLGNEQAVFLRGLNNLRVLRARLRREYD